MKTTKALNKVSILHTDCGNEFKNKKIEELLEKLDYKRKFESLEKLELFDYVNCYNKQLIHGTLQNMTLEGFRFFK